MNGEDRLSRGDFFTTLAGVTYDGRQDEIARYKEQGGQLELVPEANAHDPYACGVIWIEEDIHGTEIRRTHLGYVPKKYSRTATKMIASGRDLRVACECVTGGEDGKWFGMNIALYSPDEDARPYFFGHWDGDPPSFTVPLWD